MTSAEPPLRLDYGTPPARPRGRKLLRYAIWLVVLFALGASAWRVVRWYGPQWAAYATQRNIEAGNASTGAVLYSEDSGDVALLAGQTHYAPSHSQIMPPIPAIERVSADYIDPGQPGGRFRSGMPPIGIRRAPGGEWRLINVGGGQYGTSADGSRNCMFPEYDVKTRVRPWPGSRPKQLWYGINGLLLQPTDRVALRAGRLDPSDESHFTFDYTINNISGTVDGYLGSDDNVTFKIRSGPATTRPYKPRFSRQAYP